MDLYILGMLERPLVQLPYIPSHLKPVFLWGDPDKSLSCPISLARGREHRSGWAWPRLHGEEACDIINAACRWLSHGYVPVRRREQLEIICATFYAFKVKINSVLSVLSLFFLELTPILYICHNELQIYELNCSHDDKRSAVSGKNSDLTCFFKYKCW